MIGETFNIMSHTGVFPKRLGLIRIVFGVLSETLNKYMFSNAAYQRNFHHHRGKFHTCNSTCFSIKTCSGPT